MIDCLNEDNCLKGIIFSDKATFQAKVISKMLGYVGRRNHFVSRAH